MHWRTAVNLLSLLILCWLPGAWMQDQFELSELSELAELSSQDKSDLEVKLRTVMRHCSRRERRKCRNGHYEYCRLCSNISEDPSPDSGRLIVVGPATNPGPYPSVPAGYPYPYPG